MGCRAWGHLGRREDESEKPVCWLACSIGFRKDHSTARREEPCLDGLNGAVCSVGLRLWLQPPQVPRCRNRRGCPELLTRTLGRSSGSVVR